MARTKNEIWERRRVLEKVKRDRRMKAMDEVRARFNEDFGEELERLKEECEETGHEFHFDHLNVNGQWSWYKCNFCGKSVSVYMDDVHEFERKIVEERNTRV